MRYQYLESFQEDLLLCKPLPTNKSGAEIFKLIDEIFTVSGIPWDNCVGVCTDGEKAMTGKTSGVISRIKQKVKECSNSHCVLHHHALAVKKIPPSLKEVLDERVKIILSNHDLRIWGYSKCCVKTWRVYFTSSHRSEVAFSRQNFDSALRNETWSQNLPDWRRLCFGRQVVW